MAHRKTAAELEREAAGRARRPPGDPAPSDPVLAFLARRGFTPRPRALDLPFDPGGEAIEAVVEALYHYAFRLFLRGAIARPEGFSPEEPTRYLDPAQARAHAEDLVGLGLAERCSDGRYRLLRPTPSFGPTLEWWVARELSRRRGFDTACALDFHHPGVGGDLDVVAVADGRLAYLELKSGPPKHLSDAEVAAFHARRAVLRPDLAVFVVDTALRLEDKVVPMLADAAGPGHPAPRRLVRELWDLGEGLYAVNADRDLVGNLLQVLGEGLRAAGGPPG